MYQNIFELPPLPLSEEQIDILAQNNHVLVERIVSTGQTSSWQSSDRAEYVILLQGEAELTFEDSVVTLTKGSALLIPPRQRHRVSQTSETPPCIWLCVHYAHDESKK